MFNKADAYADLHIAVPCGKCLGCALSRSRGWAARVVHEASMYARNVFVTLTYDAKHLPIHNGVPTLRPTDFVKFMKRLRKVKPGVRFLQSGEYGAKGRPHHHAILFNCSFPDMVVFRKGRNPLYRSRTLERLWPFGFSSVAQVSFESAAYVCGYTLKKVGGKAVTSEGIVPEYSTMSRRPGIGANWLERYMSDIYPGDVLVLKGGQKSKPPRYYDEKLRVRNPVQYAEVKAARKLALREAEGKGDITERRLADKEAVLKSRLTTFKRAEAI